MAFIVGLSGIDGAGKTAAAELLTQRLRAEGLRVRYQHELNYPLGKFFVWAVSLVMGQSRAEHTKSQLLTQKENNRRGLSFLYHLLIFVDDLITYGHLRLSRGVVVHDRWPYDTHLQFRSRNYDNRLIAWMFSHFPRPDQLLLLQVSARTAYERKRTDPGHVNDGPEYFEALVGWMGELESKFRYDAVIDAESPIEQVVDAIRTSIGLMHAS